MSDFFFFIFDLYDSLMDKYLGHHVFLAFWMQLYMSFEAPQVFYSFIFFCSAPASLHSLVYGQSMQQRISQLSSVM